MEAPPSPGSSRRVLKAAGYSFWRRAAPDSALATRQGGLIGASKVGAEQALRAIVSSIGKEFNERQLPEIGYAMKIYEGRRDLEG